MTERNEMNDPTIDTSALMSMLEQDEPVIVLDVRPSGDREEWHIPGSIHVDAYDALKQHEPGPIADVDLPSDKPIVTVCGAGKTSLTAAKLLRKQGIQAMSLAGGMKAWSLAFNSAEITLSDTLAEVVQIRRTGKGCLSYVIGSDGEAAVIDASLPPEVYMDLAERRGWRISHVLDTHIHADHLSRSRALADMTGASFLLPEQDRVAFEHEAVRDGDVLAIGKARLRAIRTPGHTPESTTYVLDDAALFTGDTLFTDGVGRPDLETSREGALARAGALYESLHRLVDSVPYGAVVLAGHTSQPVPFDHQPIGKPLGAVRGSVEMLSLPKEAFVQRLLDRIPPTPPNFERIVDLNESGATDVDDVLELEAGANRCAVS